MRKSTFINLVEFLNSNLITTALTVTAKPCVHVISSLPQMIVKVRGVGHGTTRPLTRNEN